MKQAVLILLHKDIEQVARLVGYFQGCCDIFLHVDKDCRLSVEERNYLVSLRGVVAVYQKYHVNWAGFSMLKTEMFLLRKAMGLSKFRYVHLLSGSDYPIKPLSHFLEFFGSSDKEFVSCRHLPNPGTDRNTFSRLQYIFLADYLKVRCDSDAERLWILARKLANYGIRRRVPDEFQHLYNGSQWFSLTRKTVSLLIEYTNCHPSFYHRMRFSYAPEETYVNTVVRNLVKEENVSGSNLRYIRWPFVNAQHPTVLGERDFFAVATSEAMFMRKVDSHSGSPFLCRVDDMLLREEHTVHLPDGQWCRKGLYGYVYDHGLAEGICYLCSLLNIGNAIDLGCGPGYYVRTLRDSKIMARGFDGNPYVREQSLVVLGKTHFPCERIDLHRGIEAENATEMTILLDVGEYIPEIYTDVVFDNVCRLSSKYAIVCWMDEKAAQADGSQYVRTPLSCETVRNKMKVRGFFLDVLGTELLRVNSHLADHTNNIQFFKKNEKE